MTEPRPWTTWDQTRAEGASRRSSPFDDTDPTVDVARVNRGAIGYEPPSYHRAPVALPGAGLGTVIVGSVTWAILVVFLIVFDVTAVLVIGVVLAVMFALGFGLGFFARATMEEN